MEEVEILGRRNDDIIISGDLGVEVLMLVTHDQLIREIPNCGSPSEKFFVIFWWKVILYNVTEGLCIQVWKTLKQFLAPLILLDRLQY